MSRLLAVLFAAAIFAAPAVAMPVCHDPRTGQLVNCPHVKPVPRCLGAQLCGTVCIPRDRFCPANLRQPGAGPQH